MNQLDFLSPEEIYQYQWSALKRQVYFTLKNSPFYKKSWRGFSLESFKLEEFLQTSITRKQDIQQFNNDFRAVPPHLVREITSTSGSEGSPIYIYQTESDLKRLALNEQLSYSKLSLPSYPTIQLMLTLDKLFMAGMAYYKGAEAFQAQIIRSGPGQKFKQVELLKKFTPDLVVAVPSFLLQVLQSEDLSPYFEQHPLKILGIGENLRDEHSNALPVLSFLNRFNFIDLYGTYASTEMQTAFTECNIKNGFHVSSGLIYVECLDEDGQKSDRGELIITHLGVEGFPLLRYATGDMVSIDYTPCECGRNTPRIQSIIYRKQQKLKVKGTTLFATDFEPLFQQFQLQNSYYIIINKDELGLDDLKIFVDSSIFDPPLLKEVEERIHHSLKIRIRLIPQLQTDFQKALFKNEARKPIKIQDLRTHEH